MQLNNTGLNIIKKYEGLRLKAYYCPAGVCTIGYGHTGPDVHYGMMIDVPTAERFLAEDLAEATAGVTKLVRPDTTDNEFSALVSFTFNEGVNKLRTSTLLKKHNNKDKAGAAAEFPKWKYAAGKVLTGLLDRRNEEAKLYNT